MQDETVMKSFLNAILEGKTDKRYKRGIEDGMKQGIQQGIDCTVRLLYSSGMSIKEISERLNMTESQIGTIVG